jgi:hypothetical protein
MALNRGPSIQGRRLQGRPRDLQTPLTGSGGGSLAGPGARASGPTRAARRRAAPPRGGRARPPPATRPRRRRRTSAHLRPPRLNPRRAAAQGVGVQPQHVAREQRRAQPLVGLRPRPHWRSGRRRRAREAVRRLAARAAGERGPCGGVGEPSGVVAEGAGGLAAPATAAAAAGSRGPAGGRGLAGGRGSPGGGFPWPRGDARARGRGPAGGPGGRRRGPRSVARAHLCTRPPLAPTPELFFRPPTLRSRPSATDARPVACLDAPSSAPPLKTCGPPSAPLAKAPARSVCASLAPFRSRRSQAAPRPRPRRPLFAFPAAAPPPPRPLGPPLLADVRTRSRRLAAEPQRPLWPHAPRPRRRPAKRGRPIQGQRLSGFPLPKGILKCLVRNDSLLARFQGGFLLPAVGRLEGWVCQRPAAARRRRRASGMGDAGWAGGGEPASPGPGPGNAGPAAPRL